MARGGVVIRGVTAGSYELTSPGTAGQVFTSNGEGADPTFQPAAAGYTDEEAQDAVGWILTDTATIDLTYTDATPSIAADVKANSITNSLIRQSAATSIVGRSANSTGNVADIAGSAQNQVLAYRSSALVFTAVTALGHWSPLTNGDPGSPELIFDGDGDVIMVWEAS